MAEKTNANIGFGENDMTGRKAKMADRNTATIGFEKQIWDAACVLWGHIPAAEYRIPFWNTDECCNCSALRDGYILS